MQTAYPFGHPLRFLATGMVPPISNVRVAIGYAMGLPVNADPSLHTVEAE